MPELAILALADGSVFEGISIGICGATVGEVVFNTAMTGYQEMLTDPSYSKQILTLTYPHVGNTGCNTDDDEAERVYAAGLIIRDLSILHSNWRATMSLPDYLAEHRVVAIAEIDTRRLTRILREKGAQNGCILAGENINAEQAILQAQQFSGLKGMDLASVVTTKQSYPWTTGTWQLEQNSCPTYSPEQLPLHVVAYDFGIKQNILRMLVDQGCRVTVVPATTTAAEVLALTPDGVLLSNGPGDPEPCDYAINAIRELLAVNMPILAICLGHQLLALAIGGQTLKMKFGHHGANHPVKNLLTGQVAITSQNHGFAVDEASLPENVEITYKSLFDQSLQGFRLIDKPAFSFQGHPEASPGPHDLAELFKDFTQMMREYKK